MSTNVLMLIFIILPIFTFKQFLMTGIFQLFIHVFYARFRFVKIYHIKLKFAKLETFSKSFAKLFLSF